MNLKSGWSQNGKSEFLYIESLNGILSFEAELIFTRNIEMRIEFSLSMRIEFSLSAGLFESVVN